MPQSNQQAPLVAIIMGSQSDEPVLRNAAYALEKFGVAFKIDVVSAHRTPEKMVEFAKNAKSNGYKIIIAGAGGAAHLPGMVASLTTLPVIGVPIKSKNSLDGWDSLLSIAQMPGGVPVATVAVNGAENAGILAVQMLAIEDGALGSKLEAYKEELKIKVQKQSDELS